MDKVKLTADILGETREFSLSHAQRLFDLQKRIKSNDWILDDNRYFLSDGIIKPVGDSNQSQKSDTNTGSTEPSKTAKVSRGHKS